MSSAGRLIKRHVEINAGGAQPAGEARGIVEENMLEAPALGRGALGSGGRKLLALCRALAIVGGLVFVGLVVMELVSIVGRKLFAWTVPGDVEILQMCAAFASATFFAYCHMVNGDVKVDFFTQNLAPPRVALLDAAGSFLVGTLGTLLAWRTAAGAWSLKEVGETSAILGAPVWIAQALMVPGFVLLAVAGFFMTSHLLRAALRGWLVERLRKR